MANIKKKVCERGVLLIFLKFNFFYFLGQISIKKLNFFIEIL